MSPRPPPAIRLPPASPHHEPRILRSFAHTDAGDLVPLLSAFFDTEVGGKREAGSYRAIAERLGTAPGAILFLSDVVAELDAAREAGLRTVLVDRRQDYPQPRTGDAANGHARAESFADIAVD